MVSSLPSIVLYSVPIATLFEMLKILIHLPMGQPILRALFRRCGHQELRDLAKTLPWDHPIARKLDHEVHRRRMAVKSYFFICLGVGPFPHTFFFFHFLDVFPGMDFFYEKFCGPSTSALPLGNVDWVGPRGTGVPPFLVEIFFIDSLEYVDDAPVCHIYQWLAHPSRDVVCNHCERMMERV